MLYSEIDVNSLPDDRILAWPKSKAFADDISKVGKTAEFVPDRVVNNVQ